MKENNEEGLRTGVIYARVSSVGDRQSPERQVADLKRYADASGIRILETFVEKKSGAAKERPVLGRCLDFCKSAHPDLVLVTELSRLGRNTLQVLQTIDTLTKAQVSVRIQDLGVETLKQDRTENPIAGILVTVMAQVAQIERSAIHERLESGKRQWLENGGKPGRPVGTRLSKEQLLKKYPKVVRLLRQGVSTRTVAEACGVSRSTVMRVSSVLNERGSP